jgi:hypothetical protein
MIPRNDYKQKVIQKVISKKTNKLMISFENQKMCKPFTTLSMVSYAFVSILAQVLVRIMGSEN